MRTGSPTPDTPGSAARAAHPDRQLQAAGPTLSFHGPHGYVVPRIETDSALLDRARQAGARFKGSAHVAEVVRSPDGRVAGVEAGSNDDTSRFEAPLVVVADGSGGGLVRERKAHRDAVARRQYFRNVSGPDKDHLHIFATRELNERARGLRPGLLPG